MMNRLWCDLNSNTERAEFIECGRAVETGIIAPAIAKDLAAAYRDLAQMRSPKKKTLFMSMIKRELRHIY